METTDHTPVQADPKADEQRAAIFRNLCTLLTEKRKAAIEAREQSGIEDIWQEDQDHYDGKDEANRGATWSKGRSTDDRPSQTAAKTPNRSTVFLRITRPYVDAAAARVSDMLLPSDDRNWEIKPTPLPTLKEAVKDERRVSEVIPPQKMSRLRQAVGRVFGMGQPEAPPDPKIGEMAKQELDRVQAQAKKAQEWIDDCLVECRYHAEVRKLIETSARLGTGILKGPTPKKYRHRAVVKGPDGWSVQFENKTSPESKSISPWRLYPAPDCGDNIHNGSYVFEDDDITGRKLAELKGLPGYLTEAIDACIEEGPCDPKDGTKLRKGNDKPSPKELFRIWYFHGHITRDDLESCGCECKEGKEAYPVIVTMVNDRVIRAALSPVESGEFPYDVMVWQAQPDQWAGIGVARQMRECQKGANAAVRNLMDNAGLAAGPQIIVNRSLIVPANGRWELTPRKVWWSRESDNPGPVDVRSAFTVVRIDMLQDQLTQILQMWLQKAEDCTGLPMLLQGQQGQAPDTVGGMTIMNNNGSTVLRRIARTFDDRITEPHIGRYYEYLLLDPTAPADAKGDMTIDARGSSALLERDMHNQQIPGLLTASLNPAYGLDPELVMQEFLKGLKFDPKRMALSDEKKEEMKKQPPPEAPAVTAAKIREEGAAARQEKELQARATQGDAERQLKKILADMDDELGKMELSEEARKAVDDHKVKLASLQMQLRQQAALSPGPQVLKPPTEPAGRARPGMAYPA